MKSKLWLACVLGCFLATRVEGFFRILGGAIARPREFQYVVGIGRFSETGEPGICTGGIIDEKFVITAAHCLTNVVKDYGDGTFSSEIPDSWVFVYTNTTNFSEDLDKSVIESRSGLNHSASSARRAVRAYILSEFLTNAVADIAILELESPLNLNDGYHRKLKLPTGRKISYVGAHAVLAGFGWDQAEDYDDEYNHINDNGLKKTHFRIIPDYPKCQRFVEGPTGQSRFCMIAVTEDNGYPDHPLGACSGDSGGPIVQGNTVIAIMTSVDGNTCDGRESTDARIPQMSVKVRNYKNFINSVIGNRHWQLGNSQSVTEFKFRS